MKIQPLVGALGAEILDIDLSVALPPDTLVAVRRALFDYQVIVFREQRLSLEQHKNFARQFGPLHVHPYIMARPLDGHPEVLRVVKEKEDRRVFGEKWHSDVTFLERPVLGSVLYAIETPQKGGDTLFANMYMAYERLSAGMKAMLETLVAIHETPVPEVDPVTGLPFEPLRLVNARGEHPVVAVHPETGRNNLHAANARRRQRLDGRYLNGKIISPVLPAAHKPEVIHVLLYAFELLHWNPELRKDKKLFRS